MKRILNIIAVAVMAILANSCTKNNGETASAIPAEVIARVQALNLSTSDLQKTEGGYIAEQDIFLSNELLNDASLKMTHYLSPREDHYRVSNLVTGLPRTIGVRYTGATASISTALNQAIARYNALNLQLRFQRVTTGGNITVSNVSGVPYNATAGFPLGGNPYNSIRINSAITTWPVNTLATLLAHEIGHCIGFAHTDIIDAFSCPPGTTPEGPGAYIHIFGTPTLGSGDPNSWMMRCISPGINRPFTMLDQNVLNIVY